MQLASSTAKDTPQRLGTAFSTERRGNCEKPFTTKNESEQVARSLPQRLAHDFDIPIDVFDGQERQDGEQDIMRQCRHHVGPNCLRRWLFDHRNCALSSPEQRDTPSLVRTNGSFRFAPQSSRRSRFHLHHLCATSIVCAKVTALNKILTFSPIMWDFERASSVVLRLAQKTAAKKTRLVRLLNFILWKCRYSMFVKARQNCLGWHLTNYSSPNWC